MYPVFQLVADHLNMSDRSTNFSAIILPTPRCSLSTAPGPGTSPSPETILPFSLFSTDFRGKPVQIDEQFFHLTEVGEWAGVGANVGAKISVLGWWEQDKYEAEPNTFPPRTPPPPPRCWRLATQCASLASTAPGRASRRIALFTAADRRAPPQQTAQTVRCAFHLCAPIWGQSRTWWGQWG